MDRKPVFRKELYTEQIGRLVAACNWLGIERGRAARYSKLIREFFENDARSEQHILAIGESYEIVDLFELWEHRATAFPGLAGKIRTVCSKGPLLREEENSAASSNRARNDAFGYLVAGRLLAAGVPVVAVDGILMRDTICESEADVTLEWHGALIDIECKRPRSYVALEERTKEGREQLQRPCRGGRHGAIALDCSVLVRQAGTLLESGSGEVAERLISTKLQELATPKVVSYLTNSMLGFLFFARVPAMIRVRRSPIVTAMGKPIYDFRPDSISTWLIFSNAQYAGLDILRGLADRLLTAQGKLIGSSVEEDVIPPILVPRYEDHARNA
jgi:hypothetical protein